MTLLQENGIPIEILYDDIVAQRKSALDDSFTLISQADYIDCIKLTEDREYEGLLISQDFDKNRFTFQDFKQGKITGSLSEILASGKKQNDKYRPNKDLSLDVTDICVNEKKMVLIEASTIDNDCEKRIIESHETENTISLQEGLINIEMLDEGENWDWMLIKYDWNAMKRNNEHEKNFTVLDLINGNIRPERIVSLGKNNNILRKTYRVEAGFSYLMFNYKTGVGAMIKVERAQ